jgi:hypothetical protein
MCRKTQHVQAHVSTHPADTMRYKHTSTGAEPIIRPLPLRDSRIATSCRSIGIRLILTVERLCRIEQWRDAS